MFLFHISIYFVSLVASSDSLIKPISVQFIGFSRVILRQSKLFRIIIMYADT